MKDEKISNLSAPNPVSLAGFLLMLILLNPLIILKEICFVFHAVVALFLDLFLYIWGQRNKLSPHRNVTQNLGKEKPDLSLEELIYVMEKIETLYNPDAGKLQDRMGSVEFTELFEEQEPSLEEVKEAFCIFDKNSDGYIDAAELNKVIASLSSTVPTALDCESMIRTYDNNGDGLVDFNEFLQLVACSFN